MFNQTALRALKLTRRFKAFLKYTRDLYMWLILHSDITTNERKPRDILSQRRFFCKRAYGDFIMQIDIGTITANLNFYINHFEEGNLASC